MTKKLTLAEAAQEILKSSIAKAPKEGPKKLEGEVIDTGEPIVKNDQEGKVYNRTIKKDGSEPTKGSSAAEPMKKLPKGSIPEEKVEIDIKSGSDDDDDDEKKSSDNGTGDKVSLDGKDVDSDNDETDADKDSDDDDDDEEEKKSSFDKMKEALERVNKDNEISEDIKKIFKGSDLSEEFIEKATTIYEAALGRRVKTISEALIAEYDNILAEEIGELESSIAEEIDGVISIIAKEWLEENKVVLESNLRNQKTEEFISGLKNLFAEHYMDIPEEKVDVVEGLLAQTNELKDLLDEQYSEKIETHKYITELEKQIVLNSVIKEHNLNLVETEKIEELAEEVKFTTPEAFEKKINTLIESFLSGSEKNVKADNIASKIVTEELQMGDEPSKDVRIVGFVNALNKFSRNNK